MRNSLKTILAMTLPVVLFGCALSSNTNMSEADQRIVQTANVLANRADADSLAAAGVLNLSKNHELSLSLIDKATVTAPTRADLVWLQIQVCQKVPSCNSEPMERHLRQLDPANGAGWMNALVRADFSNDDTVKEAALEAISRSDRVDIYWTTLISHLSRVVAQTKNMSTYEAEVAVIGFLAAQALPAYSVVSNACKGERLNRTDVVEVCRGIANTFERGDVYITEMIGVAIAKRVWPQDSFEWKAAMEARRMYEYRSKLWIELDIEDEAHAQAYLSLCANNRREQDVLLAQLIAAGKNPMPPAQ